MPGMTWGTATTAVCNSDHWLALDGAVARRGIVSGRCEVDPVLHRTASTPGDGGTVTVLLDGQTVGHLPDQLAAQYAEVFDQAGVVDVQISGLIVWSPLDRVPEYDIQVFASDPGHLLPVNHPGPIPTMRANTPCASVARTFQPGDAARITNPCASGPEHLPESGVSVWATATALNQRDVEVSLFGSVATTGSAADFAAAVLRTTSGRTGVAVNVEAMLSGRESGPQLRAFYPIPWVRPERT